LHVPLPHTFPAPHEVPSATFPVAVHTGLPPEQSIAPVRHGFAGEQGVPVVHDPPSDASGVDASGSGPSSPEGSPVSMAAEAGPSSTEPVSAEVPPSVPAAASAPPLVDASSTGELPAIEPLAQAGAISAESSAQTAARTPCRIAEVYRASVDGAKGPGDD